ncbi:hypothetical protein JN11_04393 [Mucilaginibacter frigoritolerans]|uniref:Uncharacterized protein n=1 Tax=Mucilaginibacter frigoritolerans TaxID=652788 RepID=A0A562TNY3_9SPHI|nr:hypothetical protein JN11_04393 [Mucilaginibacter frigoritolerans]
MKILDLIKPGNSEQICQKCIHFQNDPAVIEAVYPGLTIMSSGFASVRDQDGLCNYNQLYLSARDSCPHFIPRISGFNRGEIENSVRSES